MFIDEMALLSLHYMKVASDRNGRGYRNQALVLKSTLISMPLGMVIEVTSLI